jgi:hypothetical protein
LVAKNDGTNEDGQIDANRLRGWLIQSQALTRKHARKEVGDIIIGQLLARSPMGADGVWPCEPVREALEEFGTAEIAKGMRIGVYNLRGAFWGEEGGGQERGLAEKYRTWSRSLANQYDDLHSRTSLSSKVLVNASVLELLPGFAEFAVKEIVKLVEPAKPIPRDWSDLINILRTRDIFTGYPENYAKHVQNHRETVRNNFAHGNWEQLAVEVGSVDLDEALVGTVEFVHSMQATRGAGL